MKRIIRNLVAMVGVAVFCAVRTTARGEQVTYVVDPSRSSLTISGTYAGEVFQAEEGFGDSLTASYGGTITADRDFGSETLQITGGTVAAIEGGAYAPFELPSDYGIDTTTLDGFIAIRNFGFSISSPLIGAPESFNSSLLTAAITMGLLDHYQIFVHVPGSATAGYATDPMTGGLVLDDGTASLRDSNGIETLVIPVSTNLSISRLGTGSFTLELHFSGTIVAVAAVPEPVSIGTMLLGIVAIAVRRPRRGI
jgi:hypothetical protein